MTNKTSGLIAERWGKFSHTEQMANIGSEVHRAIMWKQRNDETRFQTAFERALELFDLTLADQRSQGKRKEIARTRELFCTYLFNCQITPETNIELEAMDKYFYYFAVAAQIAKART